ncbi:MAG TPA: helix-turn-helix domain-containing protein [Pirellulales bacterium]
MSQLGFEIDDARYYNPEEVAKIVKASPRTVLKWANPKHMQKPLAKIKRGRKVLFPGHSVRKFLDGLAENQS